MNEYEATIKPQYDTNGYDCGLWIVFDTSLGYETPVYENVDLRIGVAANNRGTLYVGQFVDWDNESYDEQGNIDAKYKKLGELQCPNPFEDDDAASILLGWLENCQEAVNIC